MTEADGPIHQALAAYRAAILAKDVEAFVALFADDVVVFDMWGPWSQEGIAAWRDMAAGWFGSLGEERVVVEADDVRTSVSGDMATLTAFLTFRAIDAAGKELRSLNNRLSWVLREQAGRWKVVQEHTSIPIDGATGKGIFKRLALA
jgi:uncharacterized protein (TIGR02246 family)